MVWVYQVGGVNPVISTMPCGWRRRGTYSRMVWQHPRTNALRQVGQPPNQHRAAPHRHHTTARRSRPGVLPQAHRNGRPSDGRAAPLETPPRAGRIQPHESRHRSDAQSVTCRTLRAVIRARRSPRRACLPEGHGGGHTTWTCRTCDQTLFGPPLNTHCTALDGPATVRISTQRA